MILHSLIIFRNAVCIIVVKCNFYQTTSLIIVSFSLSVPTCDVLLESRSIWIFLYLHYLTGSYGRGVRTRSLSDSIKKVSSICWSWNIDKCWKHIMLLIAETGTIGMARKRDWQISTFAAPKSQLRSCESVLFNSGEVWEENSILKIWELK